MRLQRWCERATRAAPEDLLAALERALPSPAPAADAAVETALLDLAARHPAVIEEVRGAGLLLGIKLRPEVNNGEMQGAAVAEGLLTVAAGMNVLRLAPPLIITEAEADEAVALLDRACRRMTPSGAQVAAK
jgi:acetylornithine/succinyldiaminopimelate/putrescine aminotransferase